MLSLIAAVTTEHMLNISTAYEEYWVKTGQLHVIFTGMCMCILKHFVVCGNVCS